jgi:SAM-dependent methyltransferase
MSPLNWKKDLKDVPVESLLLLEDCHFRWLDDNFHRREFAMVLRSKPYIAYFIRHKSPQKAAWVDSLLAEFAYEPLPDDPDMRRMEQELVFSMEDWIVYALEPEAYQCQPFLGWDEKELTQMTDWAGKRVIDIGSGTGKQAFITAPLCNSLYCVEPVYNLRQFLKQRAQREGIQNIFVLDGLMTSLPFENDFADVITSGHVYGDEPALEVAEMLRVVKPGGMIILIPGNNDEDSPSHQYLVDSGFSWARVNFPMDGNKRKYWTIKES